MVQPLVFCALPFVQDHNLAVLPLPGHPPLTLAGHMHPVFVFWPSREIRAEPQAAF